MKSNYEAVCGQSLKHGKTWLQSLQSHLSLAEAQDRSLQFMNREIDARIAERDWTPEEMGEFVSTLPPALSGKLRDALTGWMTRHLPIDLSDELDVVAATMEWQPEVGEDCSAPRI
ncbi:hypothetical protein [Paradevosia shaoguanensis]|uniref:hypothetical protein n=1 Tax=Paradevosia shaoguanensis TaxID=1335043 RepID=UPI001933176E|nr:hypothetical protein [Paradevosia shaoguanensis]